MGTCSIMLEVEYWETSRGSSPVLDFIKGLELKPQTKTIKWIDKIEEEGLGHLKEAGRVEKIRKKPVNLWEFKVDFGKNRIRGLFTKLKNVCHFVHMLKKKDGKLTLSDIDLGMQRAKEIHENHKI